MSAVTYVDGNARPSDQTQQRSLSTLLAGLITGTTPHGLELELGAKKPRPALEVVTHARDAHAAEYAGTEGVFWGEISDHYLTRYGSQFLRLKDAADQVAILLDSHILLRLGVSDPTPLIGRHVIAFGTYTDAAAGKRPTSAQRRSRTSRSSRAFDGSSNMDPAEPSERYAAHMQRRPENVATVAQAVLDWYTPPFAYRYVKTTPRTYLGWVKGRTTPQPEHRYRLELIYDVAVILHTEIPVGEITHWLSRSFGDEKTLNQLLGDSTGFYTQSWRPNSIAAARRVAAEAARLR